MALDELRERVFEANLAIVEAGLVVLTFGNVSAVDRAAGVMAIKPSGVPYAGSGRTRWSSSTSRAARWAGVRAAVLGHADAPRALPRLRGVGGIVHTHSPFATAWAQAGRRSRASARPTPTTSAAPCP